MLCLGVAAILSGRTCEASCGDYVVLKGSHVKTPEAPAPERAPCNSPTCRGEVPQLPAPVPPPNTSSTEKPLALFALSLNLEEGSPCCDWLATREHARPGFRHPLERPPSF
jgi:hypothetical protein